MSYRAGGWILVPSYAWNGAEFLRLLHAIVLLPAQIVHSGRRIIDRVMGYKSWLRDFFAACENFVEWHVCEHTYWRIHDALGAGTNRISAIFWKIDMAEPATRCAAFRACFF
jgi:hypothetical protein